MDRIANKLSIYMGLSSPELFRRRNRRRDGEAERRVVEKEPVGSSLWDGPQVRREARRRIWKEDGASESAFGATSWA